MIFGQQPHGCEFLSLWSRQLSSKVDRYRSSNFQSIRAQSSARSWPSVRRRWVWHRTWYKTLFRLHSKQENSLRLSSRVQLTPLNRIENILTTLSSFSIDRNQLRFAWAFSGTIIPDLCCSFNEKSFVFFPPARIFNAGQPPDTQLGTLHNNFLEKKKKYYGVFFLFFFFLPNRR